MSLLNFKKQFVAKIEAGEKTHTIRALRKRPVRAGEMLYLYTGLRQKGARRIIAPTPCTRVERIWIHEAVDPAGGLSIMIGDHVLDKSEADALAKRDGFDDLGEMASFWDGRLPFEGQIIHWRAPGGSA